MGPTPTGGSSREYSTMGETLIERRRVDEEGLRPVKFFSRGGIRKDDSTLGIRGCKFCASSRGKTEPPSVIRIYWA
jgi:hypothetical protein